MERGTRSVGPYLSSSAGPELRRNHPAAPRTAIATTAATPISVVRLGAAVEAVVSDASDASAGDSVSDSSGADGSFRPELASPSSTRAPYPRSGSGGNRPA